MTKLRDDGMMEIDDSVVAACFLGRECLGLSGRPNGQDGYEEEPTTPVAIYESGVYDGERLYMWPILIPASTVAEVCGWSPDTPGYRWTTSVPAVIQAFDGPTPGCLSMWLRTHTQEEK